MLYHYNHMLSLCMLYHYNHMLSLCMLYHYNHMLSLCACSPTTQLIGSSERALKVTQFHFTAWPDHGVPEYATPILAFHKKIKKHHKPSKGAILVHCRYTNMVAFTDLYVASNYAERVGPLNKNLCFFIDKLFHKQTNKLFHIHMLLSQCGCG